MTSKPEALASLLEAVECWVWAREQERRHRRPRHPGTRTRDGPSQRQASRQLEKAYDAYTLAPSGPGASQEREREAVPP